MGNFSQPFSGAQAELAFSGDIASGSPNKIAVQRVQEWLCYHGKTTEVDKDFGPHTKSLVAAFQSSHALPATGVVNAATWAALTAPLQRALRPIDPAGKSLNDLIVAYARQNIAENPIEIGGPNDGPWVRSYMLGRGGKIWQWCAGFVSFVLAQACQAKGVGLPFRPSFGVPELVHSAGAERRFSADGPPIPGDVFVIPTAKGGWSHTGFVLEVRGDRFLSAEGNGLPAHAPVLTPIGWRPIGELVTGDPVCGPDGDIGIVTGTYPQGIRPTFRVGFSDGSSVVADDRHLWSVLSGNTSEKQSKVLTTLEIKAQLETSVRLFLPTISPVALPEQDLPLPPYVLGLLLGDGGLSRGEHGGQIRFSSKDESMVRALADCLPVGNELKHVANSDYRLNGPHVVSILRALGLSGTVSFTKFIPQMYLWASAEQRLELLRGLMDTDGSVDPIGRMEYCTISPQLAKDVQFLVQSLGGKVGIYLKTGITYTSPWQATPKAAQDAYILRNIRFPAKNGIKPFRLTRKAERVRDRTGKHMMGWAVVSVTPCEPEETVCISVSTPSCLYLTEHFIPTHNTNAAGGSDGVCARSTLRNPARCDFIRVGT